MMKESWEPEDITKRSHLYRHAMIEAKREKLEALIEVIEVTCIDDIKQAIEIMAAIAQEYKFVRVNMVNGSIGQLLEAKWDDIDGVGEMVVFMVPIDGKIGEWKVVLPDVALSIASIQLFNIERMVSDVLTPDG